MVALCRLTKVMSCNPAHGKEYLIQHYVIKFVSDLPKVGCFLQALWFPPPIKLTATIKIVVRICHHLFLIFGMQEQLYYN